MTIVREIVTKFGFTIDEKKIKQFENSISQIKARIDSITPSLRNARRAFYSVTGTATALTLLANNTAKSALETEQLAKKLGKTSQEMQGLELVAQSTGVDIKDLVKSMSSFNSKSIREQQNEIVKLGYIINSKGIESSKKFIKSWAEFKIIINSVKRELSIQFMPVFTTMANKFKAWYLDNRKLISQNISSFINILTIAFQGLFSAINLILMPVNAIIKLFGGLENTISVLGIGLGVTLIPKILKSAAAIRALTVAMLANPVTWLVGMYAALGVTVGLVLNDLWSWAHGNESVTGYVLKEWRGFEGSFNDIMDNISSKLTSLIEKFADLYYSSLAGTGSIRVNPQQKFKELDEELKAIAAGHVGSKQLKNKAKPSTLNNKLDNQIIDNQTVEIIDINTLNADEKRRLRDLDNRLNNPEPQIIEIDDSNNSFPDLVDINNIDNEERSIINQMDSKDNPSPIIDPFSESNGIVSNNTYNQGAKVNQYISSNITVTVPSGTSSDQAKAIADQVKDEFQVQFGAQTWQRGIDAMSGR